MAAHEVASRRWRPWLVSVAVTVGIFAYLLSQVDPSELARTARGLHRGYLAAFVTVLLLGVGFRAVRFWVLLGRTVRLKTLVAITLARNLFVDLLPARLGELSYVYLLSRRAGRTVEDGLASLLLAVLFDVVALTPLLVLAVVVVGGGGTVPAGWLAGISVALAAGAYGAMRIAAPVAVWVGDRLDGTPEGWRLRVAGWLRGTAGALRAAWARGIFVPVLLLSMGVRICKFGSYYLLVLAIMAPLGYTAAGLGFFRVFLGVVGAELAAALPIHGIAGFGTFEAAWALSFSQLGFSPQEAIVSGILAHLVSQLVEYTLGGGALLYVMRPEATTRGSGA